MADMLGDLLDLLYPPRCALCARLCASLACPDCLPLLTNISGPICAYCGKPTAAPTEHCPDCRGRKLFYDSARAALLFDGPTREIIHRFKFANERALAPRLAELMADMAGPADLITWVPMTLAKRWRRGYNQAQLLARRLGVLAQIKTAGTLRKTKAVPDQNQLDLASRLTNLRGVFTVPNPVLVDGASIILVDDVYTTGSTVSECSKALKKAGAKTVRVLTLARAARDR